MIDNTTFGTRTAIFHTLGCKLNFAETSTVAKMFADKGIRRAQTGETPDVIVVNTCSVTELADKKCRQAIRSFIKKYPNATVIVTGCYAQLKSEEIAAIPGVKIVAGSDQKLLLTEFLDEFTATHEPRTIVTPMREMRHFCPSCSRLVTRKWVMRVGHGV